MKVIQALFGKLEGQAITSYTLINNSGMSVTVLDYGCTITEILTPDENGNIENIVLGFDSIEEYVDNSPYFGCIVGRVAGRIGNGVFELDNHTYQLERNNGNHHLHGGKVGLDKKIWNTKVEKSTDEVRLIFTYVCYDGEEGYPGEVALTVIYTFNQNNELIISYEGIPSEKTILNLTNHTYFNLSGNLERDILNHQLTIESNHFLELNNELLPTGKILPVGNTVFDFANGRLIRDGVESNDDQNILAGQGYDHPFILQNKQIELKDIESGRKVTIETNQPAVVLYTGTQLGDDYTIRGVQSRKYLGLCLETQGYPDAVHHENFPSIVVEKGELYYSETKYKFGLI